MTDQQAQPPEGPTNTPAPEPLPLGPEKVLGGKRKRWPWVVGALVVVLLLGG